MLRNALGRAGRNLEPSAAGDGVTALARNLHAARVDENIQFTQLLCDPEHNAHRTSMDASSDIEGGAQ